jgi:hypothetical protein
VGSIGHGEVSEVGIRGIALVVARPEIGEHVGGRHGVESWARELSPCWCCWCCCRGCAKMSCQRGSVDNISRGCAPQRGHGESPIMAKVKRWSCRYAGDDRISRCFRRCTKSEGYCATRGNETRNWRWKGAMICQAKDFRCCAPVRRVLKIKSQWNADLLPSL